jgi:hypothetical protein
VRWRRCCRTSAPCAEGRWEEALSYYERAARRAEGGGTVNAALARLNMADPAGSCEWAARPPVDIVAWKASCFGSSWPPVFAVGRVAALAASMRRLHASEAKANST